MGDLANMLVRLGLDPSDLNSGMDKATRSVKKFGADQVNVYLDSKTIWSGLSTAAVMAGA